LLKRRHICIDQIKYIGKESNNLEGVDAGLIHSEQSVYTEYTDTRRDEWQTKTLPALKTLPLSRLIEESGLSRRALRDIRAGRSRPHPRNQVQLMAQGTYIITLRTDENIFRSKFVKGGD